MQTTPGTSLTDDTPTTPPPARHHRILLWAAVAAFAYLLDQATKTWASHTLEDGQSRAIIGDLLTFHLTHNPGAAFSMGTGYTVVLTVIALTVIVVCIRMAGRLGSTGWAIALGLLLGGALGNVTDRIFRAPAPFRGHVVDFIEIPHWPVFNFADTAISIAAVLFVLQSARGVHLDGRVERRRDLDDEPTEP
ncbi:MAG TPA: signal peptidase II [Nocardioidaceae bacterium]|jgi:signal peptidase II